MYVIWLAKGEQAVEAVGVIDNKRVHFAPNRGNLILL
jgi:hypothetical protein